VKGSQRIYLMGGASVKDGDDVYLNDVWASEDGIVWEVMTASAEW
jgi:hypothetical protein